MASTNTNHSWKPSASSGSAASNVGSAQLYAAGDQRTESQADIRERERFKEGQKGSHLVNDSSM